MPKLTKQERQIQKQTKLVEKLREQYLKASKQLVKLVNPTSEEQSEAEEGTYQYFDNRQGDEHLDYDEIYAEIILNNREYAEAEADDAKTLPKECRK